MNEAQFRNLERLGKVVRFRDKRQRRDREGAIGGSFVDQDGKVIAIVLNRSKNGVGMGNNVPIDELTDPEAP